MNITINNPTIDCDPEILEKIKEMINDGLDKLKTFVKSKINSKFKIYYELEEKLNKIADKLRNLKSFSNEFGYYRFIKGKILHIVHENCKDNSFGHCDFAIELLDFFIDVWSAKIRLNSNFSNEELEIYEKEQIGFKKRHHEYRRKFYCDIYVPSGEFSEEEMYNIHKSLRE